MVKPAFRLASRFMSWWVQELAGLVPDILRPSRGPRGLSTIVATDKSRIQLIEERNGAGRVIATAELSRESARTDPLEPLDPIRLNGLLGIRVPFEACFSRSLHIPSTAVADAPALAALDLERATPFRPGDVMTAVLMDRSAATVRGMVPVRQLVLKRETVQPILDALAARGLEAKFVDCWTPDRATAMPVDFLASVRPASAAVAARGRWLDRSLAAATVLGLLTAIGLVLVKQANALAVLDVETKAARQTASAASDRLSRAEVALADAVRLRNLKSRRPLAIGVLDAVTKLLPDDAFLTEFSLEGDQIDMTGFAVSAAPLLEVFERSEQFTDARFSAPFRYDSREDRERFSLRLRVKGALPASSAPQKEARK